MGAAIYVGKLVAIRLEGGPPIDVEPCVLGVDEELGLVQADTRGELAAGDYWEAPARARGRVCDRLWYERRRKEFPRDRLWFHDLADCRAFFEPGLDIPRGASQSDRSGRDELPRVTLTGPDVEACPDPPGDFLCG